MVATPASDYADTYAHSSTSPQVNWVVETPYTKNKPNTTLVRRTPSLMSQTKRENGNLIKDVFEEGKQREYNQIMVAFRKQWVEKGKLFDFQDINVILNILSASVEILQILRVEDLRCEVTSDETILLRGRIRDLSTHWSILFDDDEPDQHEVILNGYRQKQHVLAIGGLWPDVATKLFKEAYPEGELPA